MQSSISSLLLQTSCPPFANTLATLMEPSLHLVPCSPDGFNICICNLFSSSSSSCRESSGKSNSFRSVACTHVEFGRYEEHNAIYSNKDWANWIRFLGRGMVQKQRPGKRAGLRIGVFWFNAPVRRTTTTTTTEEWLYDRFEIEITWDSA